MLSCSAARLVMEDSERRTCCKLSETCLSCSKSVEKCSTFKRKEHGPMEHLDIDFGLMNATLHPSTEQGRPCIVKRLQLLISGCPLSAYVASIARDRAFRPHKRERK